MPFVNVGGKQIPLVVPKTDKTLTTILPGQRYGGPSQAVPIDFSASLVHTKIEASDKVAGHQFGDSVASNGTYVAVGATKDGTTHIQEGAVYIFEKQNDVWTETQKIYPSDNSVNKLFGFCMVMSGNYLFVGAQKDSQTENDSGAAYVFENQNGTWTEIQKLKASDAASSDLFGTSIAFNNGVLVVGSSLADTGGNSNTGAAYVFENQNGTWTETQKLVAGGASANDRFGENLATVDNFIFVGATYESAGHLNSGAVYVFENQNGTWTQTQKLKSSDINTYDLFGYTVAASNNYMVASSYLDDFENTGSVYVFENQNGTWTEVQKIKASDPTQNDYFGVGLEIKDDTIAVGAYGKDVTADFDGAVYVFKNQNGTWTEVSKLISSDPTTGARFGQYVSLATDKLIVSSVGDTGYQGAVFVVENT